MALRHILFVLLGAAPSLLPKKSNGTCHRQMMLLNLKVDLFSTCTAS